MHIEQIIISLGASTYTDPDVENRTNSRFEVVDC